ncbi:hypothetical protein F511_37327 [Dorcoceras hygrometricum]|uniref:Uncharacterized protein n=1 Tax=Dorcoceras hygrometricum TaxID=472368 RepID=A0A2Z7AYT5_9LAMI|nr:hypothetical protein F511_37327 [Dorcoceras hygrometricum]
MNLSTVAIQEAISYEEAQAGAEAMKKSARVLSLDDISSDVIIKQEATVIGRKIQQIRRDALDMMKQSARDDATSCWESADGLVLMTSSVTSSYSADGLSLAVARISSSRSFSGSSRNTNISRRSVLSNQTQEDKSNIVEEDSGEAIDEPDASNSSIQSRAYMNQLLLLNQSQALHIQST